MSPHGPARLALLPTSVVHRLPPARSTVCTGMQRDVNPLRHLGPAGTKKPRRHNEHSLVGRRPKGASLLSGS
ncbi:hypothetical protein PHLGIDRAFT_159860 [Phlebiopsis gigantea 11061_1 CR5-6]|uniref:Uncharacterized protein n=1 Tax=Phlebiopsis gigantea (strain 11061_1 CR5-6) TaxID=745531 RepID=A0A0C3S5E1_PHLG1|nr:hypothetical protein PHLGIDRAFT_159860 [Phlebiopsis gigantea 11061_1 CR5-6]